jgi:hypothetical protein
LDLFKAGYTQIFTEYSLLCVFSGQLSDKKKPVDVIYGLYCCGRCNSTLPINRFCPHDNTIINPHCDYWLTSHTERVTSTSTLIIPRSPNGFIEAIIINGISQGNRIPWSHFSYFIQELSATGVKLSYAFIHFVQHFTSGST